LDLLEYQGKQLFAKHGAGGERQVSEIALEILGTRV
jgi:hypothetical protein